MVVVVVGIRLPISVEGVGVIVTLTTLPLSSVVILMFACVVLILPCPFMTDVVVVVLFCETLPAGVFVVVVKLTMEFFESLD